MNDFTRIRRALEIALELLPVAATDDVPEEVLSELHSARTIAERAERRAQGLDA